MDRNTTIGLVLIGLILTVFTVFNQPDAEEPAKKQDAKKTAVSDKKSANQTTTADSVAQNSPTSAGQTSKKDEAKNQTSAKETKPAVQAPKTVWHTLENNAIKAEISNQGAMLASIALKNYQSYDNFAKNSKEPLLLFQRKDAQNYLTLPGGTNTKNLVFEVVNKTPTSLTLSHRSADGKKVNVTYRIQNDNRLAYTVQFEGYNRDLLNNAQLKWNMNFLRTERNLSEQRKISTVCWEETEDGLDYLSESSDDDDNPEGSVNWVAYKQSYFSAILHPNKPFKKVNGAFAVSNFGENSPENATHIKKMESTLTPEFDGTNSASFTWYFGPNSHDQLAAFDANYEDILNYGWGLLRWINVYVVHPIFNLFTNAGIGTGIAILLLTLIFKLLLLPVQWKMFLSSVKMRIIKPDVEALNAKYPNKEDAMKKQSEMMSLYRDSGASPLAGCLPMLIQMPILLAVFRFFPATFELRQQSFLWAEDLSSYDSILDFGFDVWLYGDHISLFTLLMAGTTLLYTYMNSGNMQQPRQPGMPNMQVIMYIFPIMMIFFFNNYSSGLSYYYFISTLISILIMLAIKHFFIDEEKIKQKIELRKASASATPKKKSKFQERLEEMQRKANEAQKNNKRK